MATKNIKKAPTKKAPTKKAAAKTSKHWLIIGAAVVLTGAVLAFAVMNRSKATPTKPLSRAVLELAEAQVRATKPAPTTAALQYAYVVSAYADGLAEDGKSGGFYAATAMLNELYPARRQVLGDAFTALAKTYDVRNYIQSPSPKSSTVIAKYSTRYRQDGHDLVWDKVIPQGPGKWVKRLPADPFTPRAGEWQRWNVAQAINVPPPPVLGSLEDLAEIANTERASASRNGEDVNSINFWGGVPGTDSPGGIWQNQLYRKISADLPNNRTDADKKYAQIQKYLAQAVSDAFMECWKVKFTYWTARPDMRSTHIETAMPDPNFPSYISGHSTISKAAADVLSVMVPRYADQWQTWAMQARESRLKAGIHFEVDNRVGFDVGTDVARQAINKAELKQVL